MTTNKDKQEIPIEDSIKSALERMVNIATDVDEYADYDITYHIMPPVVYAVYLDKNRDAKVIKLPVMKW